VTLDDVTVRSSSAPEAATDGHRTRAAGPLGNERLTAWAGGVLFVLLAVEGVTIISVGSMLSTHMIVGVLLLGPVILKLSSTGYRFVRYYTGSAAYREQGPPRPLLRVLAPILVLSTIAVFGSGLALLVVGPASAGPWLTLHKASFIVWFGVATVHVLAYASRVPALLSRDLGPRRTRTAPHAGLRVAAVLAALVLGLVLVRLTSSSMHTWTQLLGAGE
jgi:hypothetical protein